MDRRRLIVAAASALIAVPLHVAAQATAKTHRVGVLSARNRPPDDPVMEALRRGLRDQGYVEGRNLAIEFRAAADAPERYPQLVAELVQLKADVIVALGTPPALAAKQGTSSVPIVMVYVSDPVGSQLVQSLARPGGNVTGLSLAATEAAVKSLELLKAVKPSIARVASIFDPTNQGQGARRCDRGEPAGARDGS